MIIATNITKQFGKLKALDNVSTSCKEGECIALIGPNGCGKTTLIKSILGMVVPDSGVITFRGKDIKNQWEYRDEIGYMPQIGRYPDNMTIGQVLDMIKNIRNKKTALDEDLIESFLLREILDKRMKTLSGGTRQKVSAALAFLFNPAVLILDEPTAGLDPLASEILKEKIIKEKGKLILITSHILSELDDVVTRIIYMQDGKLLFNKSIEDLKQDTGEVKLAKAIAQVMKI
ncbi:copper-transport ATP-binding protein NosF [Arcticibacter svalbardensis MN12-7]|uniref:Copper-transport ATP-binding protein NosF n=1 Tax=Arcticibacter svalbardensis MN12-7 TaxID=1150600 RepID=R9GNV1_9SPHI|nr:ABC transporter ATP-binding protein [Arcticibacter svalbardensis]EOR93391.1 copper-transport ATP-binding protein NosF [Arcticibacter svalbardensis MN12-7]